METSAAPMAPMMAAALPPPGVGVAAGQFIQKLFDELSDQFRVNHVQPTIALAMP